MLDLKVMFGKRLHLLSIRGISIGFDLSWLFVAILLTWTLAAGYFPHYYPGLSRQAYFLLGFFGMAGLFASIILHELGHALTAKSYEQPISRITLFIFGGLAELKDEPSSAKAEFLVALAGPLVSFFLVILFGIAAQLVKALAWSLPLYSLIDYLSTINLVIALFNLVPAFPLDGGRMFRAFLWWKQGSLGKATKTASRIGSGFGFFLILLGLLIFILGGIITGIWWMVLGLFLWQAASGSERQYLIKKELQGHRVKEYMVQDPATVPPEMSVREFIDRRLFESYHRLYPIVEGSKLLGYLSVEEIKKREKESWEKLSVRELLIPVEEAETVSPETDVMEAFKILQESPVEALLVRGERGSLVGLLCLKDLRKIISLKLEIDEE